MLRAEVWWWATAQAAAGTGAIDLAPLGQYGAIGVGIIALSIFAYRAYNREVARGDTLEASREALRVSMQQRIDEANDKLVRAYEVIQDRVIPALQDSTRSVQETTSFVQQVMKDLEIERVRREAQGR